MYNGPLFSHSTFCACFSKYYWSWVLTACFEFSARYVYFRSNFQYNWRLVLWGVSGRILDQPVCLLMRLWMRVRLNIARVCLLVSFYGVPAVKSQISLLAHLSNAGNLLVRNPHMYPHAHAYTYAFALVDADSGCILRVHGFLAFLVVLLSAFNYSSWLSYYFWHIFGPVRACAQTDVNCSLKLFVTFLTCASVYFRSKPE